MPDGQIADSLEPMPEEPLLSETLAHELRIVVSVGLRQSALTRRADELKTLLSLHYVQPLPGSRGGTYDRINRLVLLLREEVIGRRCDGIFRDAMRMLFATTDFFTSMSAVERREATAEILSLPSTNSDNFLKRHEPGYRLTIADKILDFDSDHHTRRAFNQMRLGQPTDPGVAIDWLDRFQYYYRIWTDLAGMANDITAIVARRKNDPQDPGIRSYYLSSLWFYATFQLDLDRFVEERGGLWLLSDADIEQEVADQTYFISWHAPTTQYDDGWLGLAAVGERSPRNIVEFARRIRSAGRGEAILTRWSAWMARCECIERAQDPSCELHKVQFHCDRYTKLIDSEWFKVATWYNEPPTRPGTEVIKVADLFGRFPYRLDQLGPDADDDD